MLLGAFLWDTSILRNFEISKIYWNVSLLLDQAQEQEVRFIYLAYLLIRTTLRKENREQRSFKKHFEFHNFNEILCGMTRLRNTNLSVFMQCQYTRTILKNKKMGQSRLKKHSKFQNVDEIFHCGMTRLRNMNLDVFMQCQYTRTISRKKNIGQSLLKKHSKFLIFNKAFYCDLAKLGANNR